MPLHPSIRNFFFGLPRFWWVSAGIISAIAMALLISGRQSATSMALLSLEQRWQKIDTEVRQTLGDTRMQTFLSHSSLQQDTSWSSAPYSLWLYNTNDSLIWWSGASTFLPPHQSSDIVQGEVSQPYLFPTPAGWYVCWYRLYDSLGKVTAMAPAPELPAYWKLTLKPQALSIKNQHGEVAFYVQPGAFWRPLWQYSLISILLGLTVFAGVASANILSNRLIVQSKLLPAVTVVAGGFAGAYLVVYAVIHLAHLRQGYLFAQQDGLPIVAPALFHWLALGLLCLWLSAFIHRHLTIRPINNKFTLFALHIVSASLLWANVALSGLLIKSTSRYFSAGTIFEFSPAVFIIIGISLMMAIATFLLVHRLQTFAVAADNRLGYRLVVAALAAIVTGLLLPSGLLHIHWMQQSLGLILFLTGFDLFAEQETPSLTWATVWTLLIAAFSSGMNGNFIKNAPVSDIAVSGNTLNIISKPVVPPDPLSFFSIHFVLLALLVGVLLALNFYIHAAGPPFSRLRLTLRSRLQRYLITFTLSSFLIIGWFTGSQFQRSTNRLLNSHFEEKTNLAIEALQHYPSLTAKADHLQNVAHSAQIGLWLFNDAGKLYAHAEPDAVSNNLPPQVVPRQALYQLHSQQLAYYNTKKNGVYTVFRDHKGVPLAYLGLAGVEAPAAGARLFPFLENLFNLYVFLLLATGAVAIALSDGITRPLAQIGEKLSGLRLGQNEPLQWNSRDEVGELVNQYNQMIEKLADSAERLKLSEREGAWREMAQQVAHEIKNPLTPMKLSVQYLQAVSKSKPEQIPQLLNRTSQTLLEQIDNLVHIANAFSNFAKMPTPENSVFAFDELVASVYDLFVQANDPNVDFQLVNPEENIEVYADRNQLLRVVNNLIKNAIQAVPNERKGLIIIELKKNEYTALLSIRDNGAGIPEQIREKVFYPNFTTKSSGMGLGLAMCKNIVESANGKIYFTTKEDTETTFFVELPLA